MLKTKPLSQLLSQCVSSQTTLVFLSNVQGEILAHASDSFTVRKARNYAALAASIWASYSNVPESITKLLPEDKSNTSTSSRQENGQLSALEVECEDGKLIIKAVPKLESAAVENGKKEESDAKKDSSSSQLLLGIVGSENAALGVMSIKVSILVSATMRLTLISSTNLRSCWISRYDKSYKVDRL
jgi:hypothetical protein